MARKVRPEWARLEERLLYYLQNPNERATAQAVGETHLDDTVRSYLHTILHEPNRGSFSYREMALVQLSFRLEDSTMDPTHRPDNARSPIGEQLGAFLRAHHIPGTKNPYASRGGGGGTLLLRDSEPAFDSLLKWMSKASQEALETVFNCLCSELAELARPILKMPELNVTKLTFAEVLGLFEELLTHPSGGAYEQYIPAALLDAYFQQLRSGYRVSTKGLNTTDKNAGTAGDIQVLRGTEVSESYEATGKDWGEKLAEASDTIHKYGLKRAHVVAKVDDYAALAEELAQRSEDISVIDIHGFMATMLALLESKTYRLLVLETLYSYLVRYGQDIQRVNRYVEIVKRRGLPV